MTEKLIDKTNSDWKNIYIISIFAFIDAFQFSFFVWSFWPYAQQLDSTISPSFIGIIMALSGVGEAFFAPIFGYWANRIGHINPPLISSLLISLIGNAMYTCMSLVPTPLRSHALLISRFFSGAGSANRGTYLAYVASASLETDRTKSMALAGGGALIGLVGGPSMQAAFTWIGSGWDFYGVRISMYTAPGILAMLINVSCIFFLVLCFDDCLDNRTGPIDNISTTSISNSEDSRLNSIDLLTTQVSQYDLIAVLVCMTTRAARMFVTSNVESIGSPYSQLMFNFDDTEVLQYNSLIQIGIGFLTTVMLIIYASTSYTEKVSERANVIGAMFALLVFHLVTFSWPFLPGTVNCSNLKINGLNEWCQSLKPVNLYIYYGSYVLVFGIALPCLNNSLQSLYSLVLGKGRQGTMQGINQAVGSLSRILGPIVMSTTFTTFGPQATWGVEIAMLTLFILIWVVTFRRLVPAAQRQREIFFAASGLTSFIGSKS